MGALIRLGLLLLIGWITFGLVVGSLWLSSQAIGALYTMLASPQLAMPVLTLPAWPLTWLSLVIAPGS